MERDRITIISREGVWDRRGWAHRGPNLSIVNWPRAQDSGLSWIMGMTTSHTPHVHLGWPAEYRRGSTT